MNYINAKSNTYPFVEVVIYSEIVRSICPVNQSRFSRQMLWDELKRLNRGVKCTTNTLDGHSTNADIVEHLATKYRALFSSQTTTEAKLNDIRHVIQDKVTCEGNAFVVTVTEVCEMTSKLKINKSDGLTGSCSDHFVYAPHRFAVLFTMLINVMLVHDIKRTICF